MIKNKKRKAFTLTELLVVVVVIGVLAAVVLPKYNKVLETRKTTEAESMMAAVRTEQERRCALDKPYIGDVDKLVTARILPQAKTKNFNYSLQAGGMEAQSRAKKYQLKMPSYADGRLCCEGSECNKLNKDYPTCGELQAKADYRGVPADCMAEGTCNEADRPADETRPCPEGYGQQYRRAICVNGEWTFEGSEWVGECAACGPEHYENETVEINCYEDCGKGKLEYHCVNGEWKGISVVPCPEQQAPKSCPTCGETIFAECDKTNPDKPEWKYPRDCRSNCNTCNKLGDKESESCNTCGIKTRTCMGDLETGELYWGDWSECDVKEEDAIACEPCDEEKKPAAERECDCPDDPDVKGTQTRSVECLTVSLENGEKIRAWVVGAWGPCQYENNACQCVLGATKGEQECLRPETPESFVEQGGKVDDSSNSQIIDDGVNDDPNSKYSLHKETVHCETYKTSMYECQYHDGLKRNYWERKYCARNECYGGGGGGGGEAGGKTWFEAEETPKGDDGIPCSSHTTDSPFGKITCFYCNNNDTVEGAICFR